jgi:hypothetical protein
MPNLCQSVVSHWANALRRREKRINGQIAFFITQVAGFYLQELFIRRLLALTVIPIEDFSYSS